MTKKTRTIIDFGIITAVVIVFVLSFSLVPQEPDIFPLGAERPTTTSPTAGETTEIDSLRTTVEGNQTTAFSSNEKYDQTLKSKDGSIYYEVNTYSGPQGKGYQYVYFVERSYESGTGTETILCHRADGYGPEASRLTYDWTC